MTKRKYMITALAALLTLTGCITREQADARLAKGCKAGVEVFLTNGFNIKKIKKTTFKNSTEFGNGFRDVDIKAVESDGWIDSDKDYHCTFAEERDLLGSYHRATIYQVKVDGQIYGQSGTQIMGDTATIAKMTKAVENAMGEE